MSAPVSDDAGFARFAAALVLMGAALSLNALAQAPAAPPPRAAKPPASCPPETVERRFALQILAAPVYVYAEPAPNAAVIAQLQQSAELEADQRRGTWYRIRLADGRTGWINLIVGKPNPNFSVDAQPRAAPAAIPEATAPEQIFQRQPMGRPLEAI